MIAHFHDLWCPEGHELLISKGGELQDNERTSALELFLETIPRKFLETIPWFVMAATCMGSIMMVAISQGRLAGSCSFWMIVSFCLSLAFSHYRNRRWLHKLLAGADDIGEVTYTDTVHYSWLWILYVFISSGLFAAMWLVIFLQASLPVYPVLIIVSAQPVWFLYVMMTSPTRYIITTKGIGVQAVFAHWFVYFADLQEVHREAGRWLIPMHPASSPFISPIVRFRNYVILYLKPERKSLTESRVRYLTPSDPSRFLLHLPPELVKRSDEA